MKKIWLSILVIAGLVFGVVGMSACNGNKDGPKGTDEHVYSTGWTHDETRHWHVCTTHTDCGKISGTAPHAWGTGEKENTCTVCGYERHVHAFVWEYDESTHRQVATCHTDVVENEGPHDFTGGDTCACGVKEEYVSAYPTYKDYVKEDAKVFSEYVEMIEEAEGTLGANAAGDVTYAHDGTSEIWWKARTVTVNAAVSGTPYSHVWFKVSMNKGGSSETIATAETGADGKATLTFYPQGYSSDDLTYTVSLAEQSDVDRAPYLANSTPKAELNQAITVDTAKADCGDAGTVEFDKKLGVGEIFGLTRTVIAGSTWSKTPTQLALLSGVAEGYYELQLNNIDGPCSTATIWVTVGDASYGCYIVNFGVYDPDGRYTSSQYSQGAVKAVIYLPANAESIGIVSYSNIANRRADVVLNALPEIEADKACSVFASTKEADAKPYDISALPRGYYSVSATVWANEDYDSSGGADAEHDPSGHIASPAFALTIGDSKTTLTRGTSGHDGSGQSGYNYRTTWSGTIALKEGDNEFTFYGGTTIAHYAELKFEYLTPVVLGEEFTVQFSASSSSYRRTLTLPSEGVYEITAYAASAFTGLTAKSDSVTLLTAEGTSSRYSAVFKVADAQMSLLTLSYSGNLSATFVIRKLAAGDDLVLGENKSITLGGGGLLATYGFTAASDGIYTMILTSESSLEGLTVLDESGDAVLTCGAGESGYAVLNLTAGTSAYTFFWEGEAASISFNAVIKTAAAQELPAGETGKQITFAQAYDIAYLTLTAEGTEKLYTVTLTEDASSVRIYNSITGKLIPFETGEEDILVKAGAPLTLVIIYEGEGASTLTVKAALQLADPEPTYTTGDGFIAWTAIANATSYEIWTEDGDAAIATLGGSATSWTISESYWAAGTYEFRVIAKAEGFAAGEGGVSVTFNAQMAQITVTTTAPSSYNKGSAATSYTIGLYDDDRAVLTRKVTVESGAEINYTTYWLVEEKEGYTLRATDLDVVFEANEAPVSFAEHKASGTLALTEKPNCEITVTVTIPEGNAQQEGNFKLTSLTVELWKDGKKYNPAKSNATITWTGDATSGTASFTVTEAGVYTVKLAALFEGYTYAETTVTVNSGSDPTTESAAIEVKKASAATITVSAPADFTGGTVTVEVWQSEVKKAEKSATFQKGDGETPGSAEVIIYNLAVGDYKVKVTLGSTLEQRYYSVDGTLNMTDSGTATATAEIKEKTNTKITIRFNDGLTLDDQRIVISLMQDDRALYTATVTKPQQGYQGGPVSYIFYGVEAGIYTIVISNFVPSDESRPYLYRQQDTEPLTVTSENSETFVDLGINDFVEAEVFVTETGLGFDLNATVTDEEGHVVDKAKLPVTPDAEGKSTVRLYLPNGKDATGKYNIKWDKITSPYVVMGFAAGSASLNYTSGNTTDRIDLTAEKPTATKTWTINVHVSNETCDGQVFTFELKEGSMGNDAKNEDIRIMIHGQEGSVTLYGIENYNHDWYGKYVFWPSGQSGIPQDATLSENIKIDVVNGETTEFDYTINLGGESSGIPVSVSYWGGTLQGFEGQFMDTELVFAVFKDGQQIGDETNELKIKTMNSGNIMSFDLTLPAGYENQEGLVFKLKSATCIMAPGMNLLEKISFTETALYWSQGKYTGEIMAAITFSA